LVSFGFAGRKINLIRQTADKMRLELIAKIYQDGDKITHGAAPAYTPTGITTGRPTHFQPCVLISRDSNSVILADAPCSYTWDFWRISPTNPKHLGAIYQCVSREIHNMPAGGGINWLLQIDIA
jgi:hypothetical protein